MPQSLTYETLERLTVRRPVDRLAFVADLCRGKTVLDVGCLDETALVKRDTGYWLHGRVAAAAREVIGIDSSPQIPPEGVRTGATSIIYHGDGVDPVPPGGRAADIERIVAGEFIEHIETPLRFFCNVKARYPGRELVVTTPNGAAFANTFLGVFGREAQHPDHVQIFSYKILHTLCLRAGFADWEIVPYHFVASEMILQSRGVKRAAAVAAQAVIRGVERVFPLLSFGYIVRIKL